jgi:hypothetical protein
LLLFFFFCFFFCLVRLLLYFIFLCILLSDIEMRTPTMRCAMCFKTSAASTLS